jgi:hypothetical protein
MKNIKSNSFIENNKWNLWENTFSQYPVYSFSGDLNNINNENVNTEFSNLNFSLQNNSSLLILKDEFIDISGEYLYKQDEITKEEYYDNLNGYIIREEDNSKWTLNKINKNIKVNTNLTLNAIKILSLEEAGSNINGTFYPNSKIKTINNINYGCYSNENDSIFIEVDKTNNLLCWKIFNNSQVFYKSEDYNISEFPLSPININYIKVQGAEGVPKIKEYILRPGKYLNLKKDSDIKFDATENNFSEFTIYKTKFKLTNKNNKLSCISNNNEFIFENIGDEAIFVCHDPESVYKTINIKYVEKGSWGVSARGSMGSSTGGVIIGGDKALKFKVLFKVDCCSFLRSGATLNAIEFLRISYQGIDSIAAGRYSKLNNFTPLYPGVFCSTVFNMEVLINENELAMRRTINPTEYSGDKPVKYEIEEFVRSNYSIFNSICNDFELHCGGCDNCGTLNSTTIKSQDYLLWEAGRRSSNVFSFDLQVCESVQIKNMCLRGLIWCGKRFQVVNGIKQWTTSLGSPDYVLNGSRIVLPNDPCSVIDTSKYPYSFFYDIFYSIMNKGVRRPPYKGVVFYENNASYDNDVDGVPIVDHIDFFNKALEQIPVTHENKDIVLYMGLEVFKFYIVKRRIEVGGSCGDIYTKEKVDNPAYVKVLNAGWCRDFDGDMCNIINC